MTATNQQLKVLKFIHDYKKKYDWAPTVREISTELDLSSTSTVFDHLARLKEKELIQTITGSPRAIRITDKGMEELKHG